MTKFDIKRHAQSTANELGVVAAHTNPWLSDYWKKTSRILAKHRQGEYDDAIFVSSSNQRCKEVVEIFTEYNDLLAIHFDKRLNERYFHDSLALLSPEDIVKKLQNDFPQYEKINDFTSWMDKELYNDKGERLFETNQELAIRMTALVNYLAYTYPNQTVVMITSNWCKRALISVIKNITPQEVDLLLADKKIRNLSETHFEYDADTKERKAPTKIAYISETLFQLFVDAIE